VKFAIDPVKKIIQISAQNSDIGESKSDLAVKIDGDPTEVSFNYKFLIDGILNIKSTEIMFDLSGKDGPCILKPAGNSDYIYVVMPIKAN
jgi:DNA polymerase-3 subunit beta